MWGILRELRGLCRTKDMDFKQINVTFQRRMRQEGCGIEQTKRA